MTTRFSRNLCGFALSLGTLLPAFGQTIETGPVSSDYCAGDILSVPFTATGTFQPGNVFVLQLSAPGGDFDTGFVNIASVSQTASGTIETTLDYRFRTETVYKVRVISSYPPVTGTASAGSFVVHNRLPEPQIVSPDPYLWSTSATIGFTASSVEPGVQIHWDFGEGAIPATSDQLEPPPVRYSSFGTRTVHLTVGTAQQCPVTVKTYVHVSPPVFSIPSNAIPVTPGMTYETVYGNDTLWICPGGYHRARKGETLFIEAGGHVDIDVAGGGVRVAYVKPGGSITGWGGNTFYVEESGISNHYPPPAQCMHKMPEISFDYTDAPAGGCPSLAPYSVEVSEDVEAITAPNTSEEDGREFLVQNQGSLYAAGQDNLFLISDGGRVEAAGDHCTAYVRNGGTFEAKGSRHHRIFYEEGATIIDPGQDAALFPASSISFIVQQPVSVHPVRPVEGTGFSIYPNPVNDVLTLYRSEAGEAAPVALLDMLGTVMTKGTLQPGETMMRMSLPPLPKGVYFLRVQQNGRVEHLKVFVQ